MRIVVGFLRSPEGRAALDRAVEEAQVHGAELVVVHASNSGPLYEMGEVREYRDDFEDLAARLDELGIAHQRREQATKDAGDELVRIAGEVGAGMIVIGIRKRSAVGKIVLGSNAQSVLLNADCAVLAVKAQE